MNSKHRPPRWFSIFTFLCGLYVITYMVTTEGDIASWAFPTGAIAAWMMAGGAWWYCTSPASVATRGPGR